MASEASRKKAEEILRTTDSTSPALAAVVRELQGIVAAALDEARAEGERIGAERERWMCHAIAVAHEEPGRCSEVISRFIAARGPMRGPEEE